MADKKRKVQYPKSRETDEQREKRVAKLEARIEETGFDYRKKYAKDKDKNDTNE